MAVSAVGTEILGIADRLSVGIALASALAFNFALLRSFVFPGQSAPIGPQLAATVVTSLSFRVLEYGIFLGLNAVAGFNYLIATACAVVISFGGKFFVYRNLVFRGAAHGDEPPPATRNEGDPRRTARSMPPGTR